MPLVVPIKSVAIQLDLSATIAPAGRTNANTMQPPNVMDLISVLELASGLARKGQPMGWPLRHCPRGNKRLPPRQPIQMGLQLSV